MSEVFASGDWHVGEGKEKQFIQTWTEFLQWTRKDHPGLIRAQLIQDETDPGHFVSQAEWENPDARAAWKASPDFAKYFGACRALSDPFYGTDYTRVVTI